MIPVSRPQRCRVSQYDDYGNLTRNGGQPFHNRVRRTWFGHTARARMTELTDWVGVTSIISKRAPASNSLN